MCSIMHASFLASGTAIVASFVFGFLWFGPLFGKTWAQLTGFKAEDGKCGKPPASALLLTLLGTAFTVFAMAYIANIYKPACNFSAALLVWFGFYVPLLFGSVAWEGRSWKLFALKAVFYFLNLQLIAAILTYIH